MPGKNFVSVAWLLLLHVCASDAFFLARLFGGADDDCAGRCQLGATCWILGGRVSSRGTCANLFESCCLRAPQEWAKEEEEAAAGMMASSSFAQPRRLDLDPPEVPNGLEEFQVSRCDSVLDQNSLMMLQAILFFFLGTMY